MISLRNLSFDYGKTEGLFQDLNVTIQSGSVCGLLGKNGAGKTSLLKIIGGLLFATSGSCERFGYDAKNREPASLENIYFVPEEFFVPALTAKKYCDLYAPFYPNFDHLLFATCMTEFDIADNKILTTLSYGQKKKFLISFALATNAQIILFDEPTNGLDIPSKSQFRKLIASTMSNEKLFIISTHQVHDVEKLVDNIVILDEGKIIVNASLEKIADKIMIQQEMHEPKSADYIYYEKNMSGCNVVYENKNKIETNIDLELFFNMAVTHKAKISGLFSGENNA